MLFGALPMRSMLSVLGIAVACWTPVRGLDTSILQFSPQFVPHPPPNVSISAYDANSMRVQFLPPRDGVESAKPEGDNGAPVIGYTIEVARGMHEVHQFSVTASGALSSGEYKLEFTNADGTSESTRCIPWDASETTFEMALEELSIIDTVSVSRSEHSGETLGYDYLVEFDGADLVRGEQPNELQGAVDNCKPISPINRQLTFASSRVTHGTLGYTPEIWMVMTDETTRTKLVGGHFDLSIGFDGGWEDTTVTGTVDAGSSIVLTSISMVGKVNRGDKVLIGNQQFTIHPSALFTDEMMPLSSYHTLGAKDANIFKVETAIGDVWVEQASSEVKTAEDLTTYFAADEHIKIGAYEFAISSITSTKIDLQAIGSGPDKWPDADQRHITAYCRLKVRVDANADAVEMKRALSWLPGVGAVDVSRQGPTAVNGYRWFITFQSLGALVNCPQSPCLHADKVTGMDTLLVDAVGDACVDCLVQDIVWQAGSSVTQSQASNALFPPSSVVATYEIGGVVNEVQELWTSASANDLFGTFQINFLSALMEEDVTVNHDESAEDLQTKLELIPSIGRVNVLRSTNDVFGFTWTITFLTNTGDLPLLTILNEKLTGTDPTVSVQERVKGVGVPFEAVIDDLSPEESYYVRAFARNKNGFSLGSESLQVVGRGALPFATTVGSAPDPPTLIGNWPLSETQVNVMMREPMSNGDPIERYIVEYAMGSSFGTAPVKEFHIHSNAPFDIAGSFQLQYGDESLPMLPADASAQVVANALNAVKNLRPVQVSRYMYVLTGDVTSAANSFSAAGNMIVTTPLTKHQCEMLSAGSMILFDEHVFVVSSTPKVDDEAVHVQADHGQADSNPVDSRLFKLDTTGAEIGPFGYQWLVTFPYEVEDFAGGNYPGLQLHPSLYSVESQVPLTVGLTDVTPGVPPDYHGQVVVSTASDCDMYTIGAPSNVQMLQFHASKALVDGGYTLQLGSETTDCITLDTINNVGDLRDRLLNDLTYVKRVDVHKERNFKVLVIAGSADSHVHTFDKDTLKITISSGLTASEAEMLQKDAIIQVSRNPNDFTRESCELQVTAQPSTGSSIVSVANFGACASFSGERRSLRVLNSYDYKIHFWGSYPTGQWPTLKIVQDDFGKGSCQVWTPSPNSVYATVHTIRYEGICAKGQEGTQTILADAKSAITGSFQFSYLGKETPLLSFSTTKAKAMQEQLDAITEAGMTSVTMSAFGTHGKAWHITFNQAHDVVDSIYIKHSFLAGDDVYISVYPTVLISTTAAKDDIRGTFNIILNGQTTEAIGYSATHAKVVQELEKMPDIYSVIALGQMNAGDVAVYALELIADTQASSSIIKNVRLNGDKIDPTLFLALGEEIVVNGEERTITSLSPVDITLDSGITTTTIDATVYAGLTTKETKFLPGFVGISALTKVVSATTGNDWIIMSDDHGLDGSVGEKIYIQGQELTIAEVSGAGVRVTPVYAGSDVNDATNSVYVFDNKLRTTEDVTAFIQDNDEIWIRYSDADIVQYTIRHAHADHLEVDGVFKESLVKASAHYAAYGRKWSLVFRSYIGDLNTIDALPGNDLRGTEVKIGIKTPNAVPARVATLGNPEVQQTVLLRASDPANLDAGATFALTFDGTTTSSLSWDASDVDVEQALKTVGADGVTVQAKSLADKGFFRTINFWGNYAARTLPLLEVTAFNPGTSLVSALVHGNAGVSRTKHYNTILNQDAEYVVRLFAANSFGLSTSLETYLLKTSTTSVFPSAPRAVNLGEYRGPDALSVNYFSPGYTGGKEITMYRLEWDSSPTFDSSSSDYGAATVQKQAEVQLVQISFKSDVDRDGWFTLSFGGQTSSLLRYDCSAEKMKEEIAMLTDTTSIGEDPVKIIRNKVSWGYTWKITFLNTPGDLALLRADASLLSGDSPRVFVTEVAKGSADISVGEFTNEVQEIYTDAATEMSGDFRLEFNGRRMIDPVSVDASALDMQLALQALTDTYAIKVSKRERNVEIKTAIWSVTFAYLQGEELVGSGDVFIIRVATTNLQDASASVNIAEKVYGTDPFRYSIEGLRPNVRYYLHVMAYNSMGFGSANSPMSTAMTCSQASPPTSIAVNVVSEQALQVAWSTAADANLGCATTKYSIEWYHPNAVQEVQLITTSATQGIREVQRLVNFASTESLNGYFQLSFGGERTQNLAWNAPAEGRGSVKERLERLSTIGTVQVTRQVSRRVVPNLFVTVSGDQVSVVVASSSSDFNDLTLPLDNTVWILGQPYQVNAKSQYALTIDQTVTIDAPVPIFINANGYEWIITFTSGHVGPQDIMEAHPTDNWSGNKGDIYCERVITGMEPMSGTFTVSFAHDGFSETTPPLAHDISANKMKDALEQLITIGEVDVARSPNGYGYNWLVTFLSELGDLAMLEVDGTELHGPNVDVHTATIETGVLPTGYCEQNGLSGSPALVSVPGSDIYTISALTKGAEYVIRVRGYNEEGYGYAGYSTPAIQVPRTKPTPPTSIELMALSQSMVKVIWSPPLDDGGAVISSYILEWDTLSTFANAASPNYDYRGILNVSPDDETPYYYNIPVIATNAHYIRIYAVNDQGTSDAGMSAQLSIVPANQVPGRPENVVAEALSNSVILVEWSPPSIEKNFYSGDGGLPITQYMIEWDTVDTFDNSIKTATVNAPATLYEIGGDDPITGVRSSELIEGTEYYIRVTAFNAEGSGASQVSDPEYVKAEKKAPTPPEELTLTVLPPDDVRAEWNFPAYDGGNTLMSYEIEWDDQDDFISGQMSSANVPIVREVQSVAISSDVVNEEQFIDATVEVINEQQTIRTKFDGKDEIQIVHTINNPVVDEVQYVRTKATDRNEVQELRLTAPDKNEIQAIRTSLPTDVLEIQTVKLVTKRVPEVQTWSISIATADPNDITGSLRLNFDNTACTHCQGMRTSSWTDDVIGALQVTDPADGLPIMQNGIDSLSNVDTGSIVVTNDRQDMNDGTFLFSFTFTFSGDDVIGDVASLTVDQNVFVNSNKVTNVDPTATPGPEGSEFSDNAASVFDLTYTCETYSDPNAILLVSSHCDPRSVGSSICDSCVTDFDGTQITLNQAVTVDADTWLVAGVCTFVVKDAVTGGTTITIVGNGKDVGQHCSPLDFDGVLLDLYEARQHKTSIPTKSSAYELTSAEQLYSLLSPNVQSVQVSEESFIDANYAGKTYKIAFLRPGTIPLLECDVSNVVLTSGNSADTRCEVVRDTPGSMIKGRFQVGLEAESLRNTGNIKMSDYLPWDATESMMKAALEAVEFTNSNGATESVFGTVQVKRSTYFVGNTKWSGGFTWQITFLSRGMNIPAMTVVNELLDVATQGVALEVEDADDTLLSPTGGAQNGNEIEGGIKFQYNGNTEECFVGATHIPPAELQIDDLVDGDLATCLGPLFPGGENDIVVTRSSVTQAGGFTWSITFVGQDVGGDVDEIEIVSSSLVPSSTERRIVESIPGNQLGGTFLLSFNGETTGPISATASANEIMSQLNGLRTIYPSRVEVSEGATQETASSQVQAKEWLITFKSSTWVDPEADHSTLVEGNWVGSPARWDDVWPTTGYSKAWGRQVGPLWAKNIRLACIKGGLTTTADDNTEDCQTGEEIPGQGPINGNFKLILDSQAGNLPAGHAMSKQMTVTSGLIAHNARATRIDSGGDGTSMQEILEEMENVGTVDVSRSSVDVDSGTYYWTITFLRDAYGPCEQEEESGSGERLCNSPGDIPRLAFDADATLMADGIVCDEDGASDGSNTCDGLTTQHGAVLRGDFTQLQVTGDPGVSTRYTLTPDCANINCPDPITEMSINSGEEQISTHLKPGDRFTLGTSICIFTVESVTTAPVKVVVDSLTCGDLDTNSARGLHMLLPWNAKESLVKRVLEASADVSKEVDEWIGGRKVLVERTIQGKYGEVSWSIRFISNPGYTPPGAGDLNDLDPVFEPSPISISYQVTVTPNQHGSDELSGFYTIDYYTNKPRDVSFDEPEDRLMRKINEFSTIGRVSVKRYRYPSVDTGCEDSDCSAGWDDLPVLQNRPRGGYRWQIRFMQSTGEYEGYTFPPGSGDASPLTVTKGSLAGASASVDLVNNQDGSPPVRGVFQLGRDSSITPELGYASSYKSVKEAIEDMDLYGEVDVVRSYLLTQKLRSVSASVTKDGSTAVVTTDTDIRQHIMPGDVIRFGVESSNNLIGTNGDTPLVSDLSMSYGTVSMGSPIVTAEEEVLNELYPDMHVRIDGLVYTIQQSGREVQALFVSTTVTEWDSDVLATSAFQLQFIGRGTSQTTNCLQFDALPSDVETELNAVNQNMLLPGMFAADDIKVTRSGPHISADNLRKSYTYYIYFQGSSVAGDVTTLDVASCAASDTSADASFETETMRHGGKVAHQRLSLATDSGYIDDPNGYYKLSIGAAKTNCLLWGGPASTIETELATLDVTKAVVSTSGTGVSVTAIQRLRLTSNTPVTTPQNGLFKLGLKLDGETTLTPCLDYGLSADSLENHLNTLIGKENVDHHIRVTRSGDGTASSGYGFEYLIHFEGPVSGGLSTILGSIKELQVYDLGKGACDPAAGGDPAINVETIREGKAGYTYDIYFLEYSAAAVPKLEIITDEAECPSSGWTQVGGNVRMPKIEQLELGGSSEVQTLTLQDSRDAAKPSYRLSFDGVETGGPCLLLGDLPSTLQQELATIPVIGTDGVYVSRDILTSASNGYVYSVTFVGKQVTGKVPLLSVIEYDDACSGQTDIATFDTAVERTVSGGSSPGSFALTTLYDGESPGEHIVYHIGQLFSVQEEQIEKYKIIIHNGGPTLIDTNAGTYRLEVDSHVTTSIMWNALESEVEEKIVTAISADKGDVVVTRKLDSAAAPNGYVYNVYFSARKWSSIDLAFLDDTSFNDGTVTVSEITPGGSEEAEPLLRQSIPLADLATPTTSARYLANSAANVNVYKVNGFFWTVKFKSAIGNIPALEKTTSNLLGGDLTVIDDFIRGSESDSFTIQNLIPGIPYYVRVAASSATGKGAFTPVKVVTPSGVPSAVRNFQSGHALYVQEVQEVRTAATYVSEVQTITTSAAEVSEVQTMLTSAPSSACLDNSCIHGSVAFRAPMIQTITISGEANINDGGQIRLLFERYETDEANLAGGNEGKLIPITAAETTGLLAWPLEASLIQQELEGLSSLSVGDIIVKQEDEGSASGYGATFSVSFIGTLVGGQTNLIQVLHEADGSCPECAKLETSEGDSCDISVSMNQDQAMGTDTAVQKVVVKAEKRLAAGSYKLEFDHLGAIRSSECIQFDAPPRGENSQTVENILERMLNIDSVYVTRTVDQTEAPNGFIYYIFFDGNAVHGSVNKMTVAYDTCTKFQTVENNVLTEITGSAEVFTIAKKFTDISTSTAEDLKEDLDQLPVFGRVVTSQSLKDAQGGLLWTVAFEEGQGNLPQFICVTGDDFEPAGFGSCITSTITDGNALDGTFVIESSQPIPYNAEAAFIKQAMEEMSWVGEVEVTRSSPTPQYGYSWTITYVDYLGDVPTLSIASSLTGAGSQIEVREDRKGNRIGGSFTLSYMGIETSAIACTAKAMAVDTGNDGTSMQEKLEALKNVGPVHVVRSMQDKQGGYSWLITFLDDKQNVGDIALLKSNGMSLTGAGVVAFTREIRKGAKAAGNQLWVSFDPPATDRGMSIAKYRVRWDTNAGFQADPKQAEITNSELLYRYQHIVTKAPSISWSAQHQQPVPATQHIIFNTGTSGTAFSVTFRGQTTVGSMVVDSSPAAASTTDDLLQKLENLHAIGPGALTILPTSSPISPGMSVEVTFHGVPGDVPPLSFSNSVATIQESTSITGYTPFRKEQVVLDCKGTTTTVTFTTGSQSTDIAEGVSLSQAEAKLEEIFGVEAGSIRVISTDGHEYFCSDAADTATIVFDRVYGEQELVVANLDKVTEACIKGYKYDTSIAKMSGTFQLGYKGVFTPMLNAESSADAIRYALENLPAISTIEATRDRSSQPIVNQGTVDAVQGQVYVTCSDASCDFASGAYGLPGDVILIDGTWYTIRTDTVSPALPSDRLFLGDLNGREIGYQGPSTNGLTVYEWAKGYVWTVGLLLVDELEYIQTRVPHFNPLDAHVSVTGSSCDKCHYVPGQSSSTLVRGQSYYLDANAFNSNGYGDDIVPIQATPRQVPNAPSNVNIVVISGVEIEVFFSPPYLSDSDISAYIVQWDTNPDFKHGLPICEACAVGLNGNQLTVTESSIENLPLTDVKFTIADENCQMMLKSVVGTKFTVEAGHGCSEFEDGNYPMYYYTYEPTYITNFDKQASVYRHLLKVPTPLTKYFVRVAAENSVAVQKVAYDGNPPNNRQWSTTLSAITADTVPDKPLSVDLLQFSGSALELQILPPVRDGKGEEGNAIEKYWILYDTSPTYDTEGIAPTEVNANSLEYLSDGRRIYHLTGLETGVVYYVQVKLRNSVGLSTAMAAQSAIAPEETPSETSLVRLSSPRSSSTPITTATVTWQPPTLNGGRDVDSYVVEWWTKKTRQEVQIIEITWDQAPAAEKFQLKFKKGTTEMFPLHITAENVRNSLMNVMVDGNPVIKHVSVTRRDINAGTGRQWIVTFTDEVNNAGDQPMIQIAFDSTYNYLNGRVFESISGIQVPLSNFPGTPEVQVLTIYHPTETVTGFFRLSFGGSGWSNHLSAEKVTTVELEAALEALPTIGQVTANEETGQAFERIWTITFNSNVGNLPAIVVDDTEILPDTNAFVGVKDGDNAVTSTGVLCLPNPTGCGGSWPDGVTDIADKARIGEVASGYGIFETQSADTLSYTISGLTPGVLYYASVAAKNYRGLGPRAASMPESIMPRLQVPNAPTNVLVDVKYGSATQLTVSYDAPTSDGGAPVWMYHIEYDQSFKFDSGGEQVHWCPTAPVNAVWTVQTTTSTSSEPIGRGFFKLELTRKGITETTHPIPWDAVSMADEEEGNSDVVHSKVFCTPCSDCSDKCESDEATGDGRVENSGSMQSKLEHLGMISDVKIKRTPNSGNDGGYTWSVTFLDIGDDFNLNVAATNGKAFECASGSCNGATYDLVIRQQVHGTDPPACIGSQVVPQNYGALTQGKFYYVRVYAYNEIGYSLPALAPSPQKPMVVPGPPNSVVLKVASIAELKVSVNPPSDNGGDTIVKYEVEWALDNAFSSDVKTGNLVNLAGGAPYHYFITGLVKGTFYYVRVRAGNSQGVGQYQLSSPQSLNPSTKPGAPSKVRLGVTSSTLLTVQWRPPTDDGGDSITAYVIQWDISGNFDSYNLDDNTKTISDISQRSYTFSVLSQNVYYVRVSAVNANGIGTPQASEPLSAQPAFTRPGKPHSLRAESTAAGELLIEWQPPIIPAHGIPCGGTLRNPASCPLENGLEVVFGGNKLGTYLVHWSEDSKFSGPAIDEVKETSYRVTGLNSGTTYYVRVLAENTNREKGDFCFTENKDGYYCPNDLVLEDGSVVHSNTVSATVL